MDYFDDEPSSGGGYERVFEMQIDDPDGVARRIVVRARGRFERASVTLEEKRRGVAGQLMRFDDAHGRFHRHEPGWPEPSERIAEFFEDVPERQRVAFAIAEIRARYTSWEAELFGTEGEPK